MNNCKSHVKLNDKMVVGQSERVSLATHIVSNLEGSEGNKCQCCDTLKAELHKARLDISSCKDIIKILLEEQSSQPKQMKNDGPWNIEGSFHTTSRGNSTKASSRVGNRKSNHIQVIPTTNKFKVLSNLNDPREAVSSTSAWIERVITSKNLGGKNQKTNQKKT